MFLANYADVLTDAPLDEMIDAVRAGATPAASMMVVPPQSSFHCVELGEDGLVERHHRGAASCRCGRTAATSCSARRSSTTSRRAGTWSPTAAPSWPSADGCWPPAPRLLEARRHVQGAGRARRRATRGATARGWCGSTRDERRERRHAADDPARDRAPGPDRRGRRALRRHRDRRRRHPADAVPRRTPASAVRRARALRRRHASASTRSAPRSPRSAPAPTCGSTVLELPDGRLPAHWDEAKDALEELRAARDPDLVLAPQRRRRAPGPPAARRSWCPPRSATTSCSATRSSSGTATSAARRLPAARPPRSPRRRSRCCTSTIRRSGARLVRRRGLPRAGPAPRHRVPRALRRGVRRRQD